MSQAQKRQGVRSGGAAEQSAKRGPARRKKPSPPMTVVGIGASAGGLDALKTLFRHLPDNPGIPFVVVVHLSPEHESHLADVLQPSCKMPVQQVSQTVRLEPNNVYIIPPNANLNAVDTHLRLSELEKERHNRAPIDHFFRTLTETHDGSSVGVVLTGTGTDGTLGLRHIKEAGGLTIAQDPDEAEYDGMPRSAIASGMVDFVLRLAEMPGQILGFDSTRPQVTIPEDGEQPVMDEDRVLQRIFAQVRVRTGHDFTHYKRSTVLRRVGRRMQVNRIQTLPEYLELLRGEPDESYRLFEDLLITVTEFFRDQQIFEELEKRISVLFDQKGSKDRIRVWSVGCSTGEEAYSLAMLLLEAASRREIAPEIQVFASDMHQRSLDQAREGVYPAEIASDVSPERLERFFTKEHETYRVRNEVREIVLFAPHNLLRDPPFSHLDLVVCRNVLIYLQREIQQDVMSLLHYALEPDGLLVLGTSESLDTGAGLFMAEDKQHNIYRRRNVPVRDPRMTAFPFIPTGRRDERQLEERQTQQHKSYGSIHEKVVELYAPPSILINGSQDVLHTSARAGQYMQVPGGEHTSNVYRLVIEPLRIELRAAAHTAQQTGRTASSKPVHVRVNGEPRLVAVRVQSVNDEEMQGFFLVIFDEIEDSHDGDSAESDPHTSATVNDLQAELGWTRDRLKSVVDEYEATQEEMKAANEELQSANEELRSTMEELETSKEELQSMNEELSAVNQENRHRVEELSQLSGDLQNLLAATDIATIFLDRHLRIVRFTPHVSELFNILHKDRGRPLSDLTHRLGSTDLPNDAQRVLEKLAPIEREMASDDGKFYIVRLLPYRTPDERIDGVVITLFDITERKRAEEDLLELSETLGMQVRERTASLEKLNVRLRGLVAQLTDAEQRERRIIAQVIHDHLQQLLVAVKMRINAACGAKDLSEAVELFASSGKLLDEAINEARTLTVQLRPPALYESGFISAVHWLADWMRQTHGLDVELKLDPESEPTLEGGAVLLFEAVRELLLNVVKHSGVKRCRIDLEKAGGRRLCLSVTDYGSGFDPRGAREHTAASGIGLFSIEERLASIGGEIKIESAPGNTRVSLLAPLADHPHEDLFVLPAPVIDTRDGATGSVAAGIIRVLLADDHRIVREGISSMINQAADLIVIGEASDGATAVSLAQSLSPDVVVMDVNMPELNGIAAAKAIRSQQPHVQVVGLSVNNDEGTTQAMLDAGASAFVPKDAPANELWDAIRNAMRKANE